MSIASTEPWKHIAFYYCDARSFPEPGGPKMAILHSEFEGIVISFPLFTPNTIPFVSCIFGLENPFMLSPMWVSIFEVIQKFSIGSFICVTIVTKVTPVL